MLFLLKKVRRKMLQQNKILTYLLYAIGEITLVVVDILIAVSIDDWNQSKQQKQVEINYLMRLKEEFQANKQVFENDRAWLENTARLEDDLLNLHQLDSTMTKPSLLMGIEVSGFSVSTNLRRDVWNDLYSTGNALIFSNMALQERMSIFYNKYTRNFENLLSDINDYRINNRKLATGILPAKF